MAESADLYSRITNGTPAVLLIDDDRNILDTAKDILEEAHFEVTTAATGAEALSALEKNDFNVVVVDFQLPDATGLELARKVRERNETTCVILMTGHASLEMAVKAIQEAVYDYLIKPVDPAQLLRAIGKAIEKQRLTLENRQLVEDLKRTNAEMARLNSLKTKMLTVMSHDLRTPLSSIRGYSELLKSGVKGKLTDSQKRMVEITIQESDHLNGLIGDLLDLASIDAGNFSLESGPVSFDSVLDKALARVQLVSELKEVPIEVVVESTLPMVKADAARLTQVLANLIRGSLKHATRGSRVFINASQKGGTIELKVSQTGQGFSADQLKTLLAPDAGGVQDGLRVSLAIAREIIQAHDGEIGVESRGPDQGCTFWVRLPVLRVNNPEVV